MIAPTTPYSKHLGSQNPLQAIRRNIAEVARLTEAWSPERFERSYQTGKWSARQILTHLAQSEIALGTRARMAVVTPNYIAQPWDQDTWIPLDAGLSGMDAVSAFVALAGMNLSFFERLSPVQLEIGMEHAEYGHLTVNWILHQMAGHQINHLQQLKSID